MLGTKSFAEMRHSGCFTSLLVLIRLEDAIPWIPAIHAAGTFLGLQQNL